MRSRNDDDDNNDRSGERRDARRETPTTLTIKSIPENVEEFAQRDPRS